MKDDRKMIENDRKIIEKQSKYDQKIILKNRKIKNNRKLTKKKFQRLKKQSKDYQKIIKSRLNFKNIFRYMPKVNSKDTQFNEIHFPRLLSSPTKKKSHKNVTLSQGIPSSIADINLTLFLQTPIPQLAGY